MNITNVVLVNAQDEPIGIMEKMDAHRKGLLHRAFSVFIFNSKGQMLIQQRAKGKYHSACLWTNACCSHPGPGEEIKQAAIRRLYEEIGLKCDLEFTFSFTYQIEFGNGISEHEYDHVFIGKCDDEPVLNKEEAMAWKYVDVNLLRADVKNYPSKYTKWFMISAERVINEFSGT